MKWAVPAGLALCFAACSNDYSGLPPIALGGGSVRLMDSARNPYDAYDNAYSRLTAYHYQVRNQLNSPGMKNVGAAGSIIADIASTIQTMSDLLPDPEKSALLVYVGKYRALAADVSSNSYGANWQTQLDTWEREVRVNYVPTKVPIPAAWPDPKKPTETTKPPEKPPVDTKPVVDPSKDPKPADVGYRMAYKAWKGSHTELVEKFTAGKECKASYEDLKTALASLKASLDASRQAKLAVWVAVYEQQWTDTKGYSTIPAFSTKETILHMLASISETLTTEYNPDPPEKK